MVLIRALRHVPQRNEWSGYLNRWMDALKWASVGAHSAVVVGPHPHSGYDTQHTYTNGADVPNAVPGRRSFIHQCAAHVRHNICIRKLHHTTTNVTPNNLTLYLSLRLFHVFLAGQNCRANP